MSKSNRSFAARAALLVVSSLVIAGCADDTDAPIGAAAAGAGGSPAGGTSSVGGSSGKAGSVGVGGSSAGAAGKGTAGTGTAGKGGGTAGTGGTTAGASGSAGSSGGTGGSAGKGGSGGSSGASGASGKSGSAGSSTAGSGGSAGSAGGGGSGGAGGSAPASCLPDAMFASLLALDAAFPYCVVRANTTDQAISFAGPGWGAHGGPITSLGSATSVTLTRWALPAGATAAATGTSVTLTPSGLPSGSIFWGPVVDLPFEGWSLLSYTTTAATFQGEVLAVDQAFVNVKSRGAVDGYFSGVGLLGGGHERIVYSGLSAIDANAASSTENALWSAEVCGGDLVPTGICAPGAKLASWQASSGPVVADRAGNVLAVMSTFGGNEEFRGFTKLAALGTGPLAATALQTDTNYTTAMAAIAPIPGDDGWLFIAESDPTTQSPLSVFAVRYAAANGALSSTGTVAKTFTLATAGASAGLFSDDTGLLWLAIDTGASTGAFVALRRK